MLAQDLHVTFRSDLFPSASEYNPSLEVETSSMVAEVEQASGKEEINTKETEAIGRWTEEEHQRFLTAYKMYGKDWKLIQKCVGTRSAVQARSHAQKYFRRLNRLKNIEALKTQERTPLSFPVKNSAKTKKGKGKNTDKPKTKTRAKKKSKRLLRRNEELINESIAKSDVKTSIYNEIYDELQDGEINSSKDQAHSIDVDLMLSQMPTIMSLKYDPNGSLLHSLDINEKFFASSSFTKEEFGDESNKIQWNNEGEEPRDDLIDIEPLDNSRILLSMFE